MPPLFPLDEASAYQAWNEQSAANVAQAQRLRNSQPDDYWAGLVQRFSPTESTPEGFEHLVDVIGSGGSVLDIGAGGGRFSVPLSSRVGRVVAVDGSEAMTAALRAQAVAIPNLEVLPAMTWPPPADAELPQVDVAFNSHVIYFVEDIQTFLDAMERVATQRCVVIAGERSGGAPPRDAFEAVHGEPLAEAPACNELMTVLAARGTDFEVTRAPIESRRLAGDPSQLLRRRCCVTEDSEQDARLLDWVRAQGVPDERVMSTLAIISWTPRG